MKRWAHLAPWRDTSAIGLCAAQVSGRPEVARMFAESGALHLRAADIRDHQLEKLSVSDGPFATHLRYRVLRD